MKLLPAFVGTPETNKVYNTDAMTLLNAIKSNSIDCVVTSPPYDQLRTYKGYSFEFEPIARETYRVLKPGGVCVWVVGDSVIDGSETLTSMRHALYFVDVCGFRMHDTMIWHKDGSPSPQTNRYLQTYEYMFVLSKGAPVTHNLATQKVKYGASKSTTFRYDGKKLKSFSYEIGKDTRVMDNVWYIPSGYMKTTKDIEAYEHPAMFPEELARRHIETWTNPGDLVLDYFGGSGTTAKMARQFGRDYITGDISSEYCDLMRKRLSMPYTPNMFVTAI